MTTNVFLNVTRPATRSCSKTCTGHHLVYCTRIQACDTRRQGLFGRGMVPVKGGVAFRANMDSLLNRLAKSFGLESDLTTYIT